MKIWNEINNNIKRKVGEKPDWWLSNMILEIRNQYKEKFKNNNYYYDSFPRKYYKRTKCNGGLK